MKRLKFKIYYFVLVHATSWKQPNWMLDLWDKCIDKMKERGWDDGLSNIHAALTQELVGAMEKEEQENES
jgi:hypothetical protein